MACRGHDANGAEDGPFGLFRRLHRWLVGCDQRGATAGGGPGALKRLFEVGRKAALVEKIRLLQMGAGRLTPCRQRGGIGGKACCNLRKMEPLARMMAARSAWVTGLRREQSNTRAVVPFSEIDAQGRTKFNPLADWSWNDVWHHIASNDVLYNPLHDEFMPSIGCAPCTRAIAVGEDFRAGRWWWEDEKATECGLHVNEQASESAVSMIGDTP
jgi:hypothetical protein